MAGGLGMTRTAEQSVAFMYICREFINLHIPQNTHTEYVEHAEFQVRIKYFTIFYSF